jgi:hypothetical protein
MSLQYKKILTAVAMDLFCQQKRQNISTAIQLILEALKVLKNWSFSMLGHYTVVLFC